MGTRRNISGSVLAVVCCCLAACVAAPPVEMRPLRPDLAAALYAAGRAMERGSPDAAALVDGLVLRYPRSVDALRLRQNLHMVAGEPWRVFVEARAERDRRPNDPAAIYLHARVIPDRAVQRRGFSEAVKRDPSFFHGHYGLAVASLASGDLEAARKAADRARSIRPDNVDGALLDAELLAREGDAVAASELFMRIARTRPDHVRAVASASSHFVRAGRPEDALSLVLLGLRARPDTSAYYYLATRIVLDEPIPETDLIRCATAGRRAGDFGARLFEAATRALGRPRPAARSAAEGELPDRLVSAAIKDGRYAAAAEILEAAAPPDLLPDVPDGSRESALRLERVLHSLRDRSEDADALAALSRALLGAGFPEDASLVANRALAAAAERSDLEDLVSETAAWRLLLSEVEAAVEQRYRVHGDSTDLDSLLLDLGARSERLLGRDVFRRMPVLEFPLIGAVARSDAPGAPSIFTERGVLLVLGYRSGIGVEGTMARLVSRREGVEFAGGRHDVAFVRGVRLASRMELGGNAVGGFTLPGWFAVDLDVADRSAAEIVQLREGAVRGGDADLWPANDEGERLSLWFPGGVRGRLAARIREPRRSVLAATLAHERGHIADVLRYYPFLPKLPAILLGFARAGFSPARVEVELEKTAERHALLTCTERTGALLNTLDLLPYRDDSPPHSIAYAELMEKVIATLAEDPARYPAIDPQLNLLQQLDRLTDRELADLLDRALR